MHTHWTRLDKKMNIQTLDAKQNYITTTKSANSLTPDVIRRNHEQVFRGALCALQTIHNGWTVGRTDYNL